MYDNIGEKIKVLAKVFFIIEAIAAVIVGIALMTNEELVFIGLPILFAGPIVAWVSSWFLYGFGEIIDKLCEIERNTILHKIELKSQKNVNEETNIAKFKSIEYG